MISSFIQRARHRFLWNEVIAELALAAALFMGVVVLLLLVGTQILDWRVPATLGFAGLAAAFYRTLKSIPPNYRIAVMVDSRAGLHDAISTAYYFTDPARSQRISGTVQTAQREHAEKLIPTVNLESAIPFQFPRAVYALGILGLVASSLFALRYGTRKQLDLKAPITQIVMESLGLRDPDAKELAMNKKKGPGKPGDLLDDPGTALPKSDQQKQGDLDPAAANALEATGDPDVNNDNAEKSSVKNGEGKADGSEQANGDQADSEQSDSGSPAASGKNPSDDPSGSREGPQQGEQAAGQQNGANNQSLLSKMKDAVSNLLSKSKPQANNGNSQKQSGQGQQKGQSPQNGEKNARNQGQPGQQESGDSQQGEQGGDSDNSENSQGKGGGKSSDQQAAAQPGSGIGKQDGNKDVRAAEQLAAMGKLSEIIGKRSQSVSGEMMVDVQSGPQQLRTAYSQKTATHGESGGDVSRDEVPDALQGYVQRYFEEARKADRAPAAAAKPKAAPKQ